MRTREIDAVLKMLSKLKIRTKDDCSRILRGRNRLLVPTQFGEMVRPTFTKEQAAKFDRLGDKCYRRLAIIDDPDMRHYWLGHLSKIRAPQTRITDDESEAAMSAFLKQNKPVVGRYRAPRTHS